MEEDELFFGRRQDVLRLASLIRAQYTVLLHSESGAGKSSMVEAGLRPELIRRGCLVLPRVRLRETVGAGTVTSNPYVSSLLKAWGDREVASSDPEATTLAGFLGVHATDPERPNIRVVVLDQFEELFILHPGHWPERKDFFVQVQEALDADPMLRFLFVMRGDYLARLGPYTHLLRDGLRTQCPLDRLRRDNAIEAIKRPAQEAGRSFAEGVAETLVDSLLAIPGEGGEPPLLAEHVEAVELQIVCRDLWANLPPDVTVIRNEHLHTHGRIGEILERFYDRAVAETAAGSKVPEQTLRRWFDDNLITRARTRGIVVQDEQSTAGLPNEAVALLTEQRVIRSEPRGRTTWYELTHDRLVNAVVDSNQRWFQRRLSTRIRQLVTALVATVVLSVGLLIWQRLTEAERAAPIAGLQVSGEISQSNEIDEYQVTGNRGDMVVLSVRPEPGFDSTLSLVAPDGAELKRDLVDEFPGSRVVWRLPDDGLYRVQVSSPEKGKYTLRGGLVVEAEIPAERMPPEGEIRQAGEVDVFTFYQREPGVVVVEMQTKKDLDGLIDLVGPDGALLTTAHGTSPLVSMDLSATGTYRVEASAYARTGAYTVDIQRLESIPLKLYEPMSGSLTPGGRWAFTVNGYKDREIWVYMAPAHGSEVDCSLALFGPRGEFLGQAGDANSQEAVASHRVTTAGRHVVLASSSGAAAGEFNILLFESGRLLDAVRAFLR